MVHKHVQRGSFFLKNPANTTCALVVEHSRCPMSEKSHVTRESRAVLTEDQPPGMTREEVKECIRRLSGGCCDLVLDGVLYWIFLTAAPLVHPASAARPGRQIRQADQWLARCNGETVRAWVRRLRAKGWIGKRLRVTPEGRRRLEGLLPKVRWDDRWDHRWRMVSFDVPERSHWRRNVLRDALVRLGFGKLHASLWVSPWDYLGDVQAIVEQYHLSPAVVLAMSDALGTREPVELTRTIWPLDVLNERYRQFLSSYRTRREDPVALGELLSILNDDPQLPRALLPRPWHGFDAVRTLRRGVCPLIELLGQK